MVTQYKSIQWKMVPIVFLGWPFPLTRWIGDQDHKYFTVKFGIGYPVSTDKFGIGNHFSLTCFVLGNNFSLMTITSWHKAKFEG